MIPAGSACAVSLMPWWGWALFVVLPIVAFWTLWREFAGDPQARRLMVGTAFAVIVAGVPLSAQIIYVPNCQVQFWKGVCGSWYCACMTLAGCDDCGDEEPPLPEGLVLIK